VQPHGVPNNANGDVVVFVAEDATRVSGRPTYSAVAPSGPRHMWTKTQEPRRCSRSVGYSTRSPPLVERNAPHVLAACPRAHPGEGGDRIVERRAWHQLARGALENLQVRPAPAHGRGSDQEQAEEDIENFGARLGVARGGQMPRSTAAACARMPPPAPRCSSLRARLSRPGRGIGKALRATLGCRARPGRSRACRAIAVRLRRCEHPRTPRHQGGSRP